MARFRFKPGKRLTLAQRDQLNGYIFIAPQFVGLLCFILFPVFFSLYISFTNWDMMSPVQWVGLDNYAKIFTSTEVRKVMGNTLEYVVIYIPGTVILSLTLALALSVKIRGTTMYRTMFFLPNITSTVAISLVWLWIYNPDFGILNMALNALGLPSQKFLRSLSQALPSVAFVSIWQSAGYFMVLFIAGISGIDPTYYEASRIDGANWWQNMRAITLPMLSPTLFFVIIIAFISGFQVFNEIFMLTEGGPANVTKTMVMHIYNTAFKYFRMGEASVYAWILFIIIMLVTLVQFKLQKKWVNYDV